MRPIIDIEYTNVPKDVVKDLFALKQYGIDINCHFEEEEFYSFDGGPNDILIYINNHLTELIAGGIIVNAAYDILKSGIQFTWRKVVQFYKNQKGEHQADKNNIILKLKIGADRTIEFTLKGNINEDQINIIINKLFLQLNSLNKIYLLFEEKQYHNSDEDGRHIEMYYNENEEKWLPVDFEMKRKEWDDFIRNIQDGLDSLSS